MTTHMSVPSAGGGLYHGWKVVAALFLAGMMVYGCGLYSFTLFITPLTEEFGWSRAATSGLVSVFWLSAPLTLAGDTIIRRIGGFRMIAAGVVIASVTLIAIGRCDSLALLYGLRFLMGVGKVLMACGVSILAAHWFSLRFGMALATCYAGWHFGGLVMVPLTQAMIDHVGWRTTATVLGLAIAVVALPPLFWWTRVESPFDRGEIPETGKSDSGPHHDDQPAPRGTLGQVMAQPIVWYSLGVTMLGAVTYGALLTNEAALVDEMAALHRLPHGLGSDAVSLTAIAALFGALLFGWLADRWTQLPLVLSEIALLALGALGLLGADLTGSLWLVDGGALLFGLAVGGYEASVVPHMKRCLPQRWFGQAYGAWYLGFLATLFAAPIGIGWVHDRTGSYHDALLVALIPVLLALIPAMLGARVRRLH